ncbi:hypothetical protein V8G54_012636, partial [Vigna mungo]
GEAVFTGKGNSFSFLVIGLVSQGGRRFRGKGLLFWDSGFPFFSTDGWPKVGVFVLANCSCNLGVRVWNFGFFSDLEIRLGFYFFFVDSGCGLKASNLVFLILRFEICELGFR